METTYCFYLRADFFNAPSFVQLAESSGTSLCGGMYVYDILKWWLAPAVVIMKRAIPVNWFLFELWCCLKCLSIGTGTWLHTYQPKLLSVAFLGSAGNVAWLGTGSGVDGSWSVPWKEWLWKWGSRLLLMQVAFSLLECSRWHSLHLYDGWKWWYCRRGSAAGDNADDDLWLVCCHLIWVNC